MPRLLGVSGFRFIQAQLGGEHSNGMNGTDLVEID